MTDKRLFRRDWLAGAAVAFAGTTLSRVRWARADAASLPLARFTTTYEHDEAHRGRAFNVELAAHSLDGAILAPGATLSFNSIVGERIQAYGYETSVVLRKHLLAEGVGGGTCQVASTLHAAALLAGLDIVERTPHSRPSGYIRMGLDATVVYGAVDLKVRNPRADRVVIRTHADRGTLTVWLVADGPSRPRVSLTSEIVERLPCGRTVEREAFVPEGEVHVRQHGIPGYRVLRTREVTTEQGTRRDVRTDSYPCVVEALVVNPSFDEARLALHGPEDTPEGRVQPGIFRDEPDAVRPLPVQLHPADRVQLGNNL